jgi:hypothetical protein
MSTITDIRTVGITTADQDKPSLSTATPWTSSYASTSTDRLAGQDITSG